MTPTKYIWQSKTVLVNTVIVVLAVLDALQALPAIPAAWLPYIVAVGGVLNVILRLTTSSGIAGFAPVPLGEQPAYRAAHDASGNPDAMRAAPALESAPSPEAGAPSLAEQLRADYHLPPDEETGQ